MAVRGDFDGDGRAELPVTGSGGLGLLELREGALGTPWAAPSGTRIGDWTLDPENDRFELVTDLDGDGRSELLVSGADGLAVFKRGNTGLEAVMTARNGTRFGGWLLNTADNHFGPAADYDGDGREELLITSPWGLGVFRLADDTFEPLLIAQNGTRFGGWLLNTADNHFGPAGDLDGDGRAELPVTSPRGLGIMKYGDGVFSAPIMAPNGTRFGEWLLNSKDNRFGPPADYDGDGRDELLVSSPWGVGVLALVSDAFDTLTLAPNGTRLGEWALNTLDDRFVAVADLDGDARAEIVVSSPAALGVLEYADGALLTAVIAPHGTRCGDWTLDTAGDRIAMGTEVIRVHVRILTTPTIPVEQMFTAVEQVYATAGLRVHRVSTETLSLPTLDDLDVGGCSRGEVTGEQAALFTHGAGTAPGDLVVYFVRSTVPPLNGCAAHPDGSPGAVVAQGASRWTLGHELGHVLSLRHVDDNDRLMTGNGTSRITHEPPDLIASEAAAMKRQSETFAA